MMRVTGEEGVTIEDFVTHEKARFADAVFLQQDAFDPVDVSAPAERQRELFDLIMRAAETDFAFSDKETARRAFTAMTDLGKNLNYAADASPERARLKAELEAMIAEHGA